MIEIAGVAVLGLGGAAKLAATEGRFDLAARTRLAQHLATRLPGQTGRLISPGS